jgi:hypothetical protein
MYEAAIPLLHDFLIHTARRLPDKLALVCQGKRVTESSRPRAMRSQAFSPRTASSAAIASSSSVTTRSRR